MLYKFQVYIIVIHNFQRLYSIYSYYKILAIFSVLYDISCSSFVLYRVVCIS